MITVLNKIDCADPAQLQRLQRTLPNTSLISAKNGDGIDGLQQHIVAAAGLPQIDDNALIVTNARHYEALTRARAAIERSIQGLSDGLSGDLVSQDIRECMYYLGQITGGPNHR